jgi:hypothetical protein
MPPVRFKGSLGEKQRNAVNKFVKKVRQEVQLPVSPEAVRGPSGEVVVFCGIKGTTNRMERSARRIMSHVSQEVLTTDNVWVVGVPQKFSK